MASPENLTTGHVCCTNGAVRQTALALCFPRPLRIETSKLGKHAALIGGAALGLSHLHHTLFADGLAGVDISLPELRAPDWEGAA